MTRDDVINDSLTLLGVLGEGQTVSADDVVVYSRALNRMIKEWQAQGIQLWGEQEGTVFLDKTSESYSLSSSGSHASNTVVETTLSAAEALGQTQLSVTSSAGMTAGDYIGIELTAGTRDWTTIVSVDSSVLVTITVALTGAAPSGATVYTYTTRLARPLDITSVRLRDSSNQDMVVEKISREEYFNIYDKSNAGSPINYAYNPGLSTGAGTLYVWPVNDEIDDRLKITYRRSIEDMDAASNDFDFPVEWLNALVWNLALQIAPMAGKTQKLDVIAPMAAQFFNNMKSANSETGSLYIQYGN